MNYKAISGTGGVSRGESLPLMPYCCCFSSDCVPMELRARTPLPTWDVIKFVYLVLSL